MNTTNKTDVEKVTILKYNLETYLSDLQCEESYYNYGVNKDKEGKHTHSIACIVGIALDLIHDDKYEKACGLLESVSVIEEMGWDEGLTLKELNTKSKYME